MNRASVIKDWFEANGIWYRQSKFYFFLFLIILVLGVFLVFPKPLPFLAGEFHSAFAIKGILEEGIPRMPSGVIYLRNFLGHYLQAAFAYLFGFSEFSLRLPIFLLFFPFTFLFFNYVRKRFNLATAFLAFLLVITSGWFLRYTQYIRFFSIALYLVFFSFYFFDQYFLDQKNRKSLLYFIFFASVGILNSQIGWSIFFLLPVLAIVKLVRRERKDYLKAIVIFLTLVLVFILARQLPGRMVSPEEVAEVPGATISVSGGWTRISKPIGSIVSGLLDVVNSRFHYLAYLKEWFPYLWWLFLPGLATALFSSKPWPKKINQLAPFLFFFSLVLGLGLFGLDREPPRIISCLSPFFYLGIAIVFASFLHFLKGLFQNRLAGPALLIVFLLSILLVNKGYLTDYYLVSTGQQNLLRGPLSPSYQSMKIVDPQLQTDLVLDRYQAGDKTVSSRIFGWDNYYLEGKLDQTIITRPISKPISALMIKERSSEYRLLYHNISVITDFSSLLRLLRENQRVWLITDERLTLQNSDLFLDYLRRSHNRLVFENPQNPINKVYLFDSTKEQ